MRQLLAETKMLDFSSKIIQELILKKRIALDEFNRIKEVYNYVRDDILIGYNIGGSIPTSRVLSDGYGQCKQCGTKGCFSWPCFAPLVHGFTINKELQKGAMTGFIYANAPQNVLHSWVEAYYEDLWYELKTSTLDMRHLSELQSLHSYHAPARFEVMALRLRISRTL